MRGDPHFTTADNVTYTFNGLGEYILTKNRDLTETNAVEIQVRSKLFPHWCPCFGLLMMSTMDTCEQALVALKTWIYHACYCHTV